jgi:hypothetical protein
VTSEKKRPVGKISYEKPTAVDLGPTAPIIGASCGDGGAYKPGGNCDTVGNGADPGRCAGPGNSAIGGCGITGNSAGDHCEDGSGVL